MPTSCYCWRMTIKPAGRNGWRAVFLDPRFWCNEVWRCCACNK